MPTRRDILALLTIGAACAQASGAAQLIDNSKTGNPPRRPGRPSKGQVTPAFDSKGKVLDSWWASLPLNEWVEVLGTDPTSRITPLLPTGYKDFGGGFAGVFHAWVGAAFDYSTGRMWVNGGGHQDSSNNGMYEFALEKMTWRVAMPPTVITDAEMAACRAAWNATAEKWLSYSQGYHPVTHRDFWVNGEPTAIHTYRNLEWIADISKVIRPGREHIWRIDPADGSYSKGAAFRVSSDSSVVYDAVTKKVHAFFWDSGNWTSRRIYDPIANTLSVVKSMGSGLQTSWVLPLIVGRKLFVFQNNHGTAPWMKTVDLDDDTLGTVALLNPPPNKSSYFSTGDYSARTGLIYSMRRDASFTTIDPKTGQCGTYTPAGTPPSSTPNAPYSKFRIYERANGTFMVLFHVVTNNLRIVRIA